MITYTNYSDTINASLYTILDGEFKPVKVKFKEMFDPADFEGNSHYIKVWCLNSEWVSNNTAGETRNYEYEIRYIINENQQIDRINLPKLWTNYSERMVQLLNNSRYYAPSDSYKWHELTISSFGFPMPVLDENEKEIDGLKSINARVNIYRSNFW